MSRAPAGTLAAIAAAAGIFVVAWAGDTHAQDAAAPADQCLVCHLDQESKEALAYRADIHYLRGVSCADCHGGDRTSDDQDVAMSRGKGFIGVPKAQDIPRVCGACHGAGGGALQARFKLEDVHGEFQESVHGRALEANAAGPQCVSCHGIHNISPVDDARSPVHASHVIDTCAKCHSNAAYMRQFNPSLPVDQKEKYLTSVHGKRHAKGDWKVANCVSCHSNHRILDTKDPRSAVYPTRIPATCGGCHADEKYMAGYDIPTTQLRDYEQSAHGAALLKKGDLNAPACNACHGNHGAAPPGAASVVAVCGQCHQSNEELYEQSAHRGVFQDKGLPGCAVCHGNHKVLATSDTMVSFGTTSPCGQCHHDDAKDPDAPEIHRMRTTLDSLTVGQREAEKSLSRAENLGMDVSDARYSLKDVNQALVQSRVAIHSFKTKDLEEAARPGISIVAQAHAAGVEAVREHRFRRQGLAISTLIVTALVGLLWLKIRQIERRQRGEDL